MKTNNQQLIYDQQQQSTTSIINMKFYLVSSALVLFITAPRIAAADKQRRRLRGSHVTDYSNYDEAIANAEDDEGRDQYQACLHRRWISGWLQLP